MIILDLDDTIFQTSSMDPKIFDSAIDVIIQHYKKDIATNVDQIISELWTRPIDKVFSKYDIPEKIVNRFFNKIAEINYSALRIETFEDYPEILKIRKTRILVTTGLEDLQNAKIDALGIRNDFQEIYIDDPRFKPRFDKSQIFSKILKNSKLEANQVWVIGDNPESEIRAAYDLGIKTIQRESKSKIKSELADYHIDTFYDLSKIINLTDSQD